MGQELMSRREVAAYLRVPEATLARWAYERKGPRFFRVGRHTRYRFEDVVGWLERNGSDQQRNAP